MTNLPTKSDLTSNNTTELSFQTAIGALYDLIAEMAGSSGHQNVTIATGSITPTKGIVYVNTESNASSDDLDFANPATLGSKLLIIKPQVSGRAINIRHNQTGTGKFWTQDGQPALLRTPEYVILFYWNATNTRWEEICRNFGTPLITDVAEKNAYKSLLDFSAYLLKTDNLNGITDPAGARAVLQLGTMSLETASNYLAKSGNLSGLTNLSSSRANLGLGTAAVLTAGSAANNVLQLDGLGRLPAIDGSLLTNVKSKMSKFSLIASQGAAGGTVAANTWTKCPFNGVEYSDIPGVSMTTGVLTLPAGSFYITVKQVIGTQNASFNAVLRLMNTSTNTALTYSEPYNKQSIWDNFWGNVPLHIDRFKVVTTGNTNFEVQQWRNANLTNNGFGYPANIAGVPEIYGTLIVETA